MPEAHPGVTTKATTGTRTSRAKPDNDPAVTGRTTATTNASKIKPSEENTITTTPTAAELSRLEWEQAQARHAAAVQEVAESAAALAALNSRLDDGDDTVTVDDLDRAELAIKRASRLVDSLARIAAEAKIKHDRAAADLRLAERLTAPLGSLARVKRGPNGEVRRLPLFHFAAVPWDALADQRPSDSTEEGMVIYVSQNAPTKRNARTGLESGTVIFAVPSNLHLPYQSEDWIEAAKGAGMLIGERGMHGSRSLKAGVGGREQMTMNDGLPYDLHRVAVEEALPGIPVITESKPEADSQEWVNYLIGQIEHRATRELRYANPIPFVRDARITSQ